jgi:hypothetical protein
MKKLFFKNMITRTLRLFHLLIAVLILNMLVMCRSQDPALNIGLKVYVSAIGNDSWSGKLRKPNRDKTDGPFLTLEGARNAIRKLKETNNLPTGNVIVEIQQGIYQLPVQFELEARDGGADSLSRIIYRGKRGDEIRLSGGKTLVKWELVTDRDVLGKFNMDVRDKIYQTNLLASGITDFGSPAEGGIELFFNDKPMWVSRYPNEGFVKITGLLNEESVEIRGIKGIKTGKFYYDDQRIDLWEEEKDAWVHGYWFWDWSEQRHKILNIDTEKNIIEVTPPYHHYGYREGQWFYGFNLLSEIDQPGEYYIDREEGILYFYPPSDIEKGNAYVSLSGSIINITGGSYITIQGIIMEGCRETAVKIENCNNILIEACTVRNVGDWAVTIGGGTHNGVHDCDIYEAGGGGIRIDAGDRKTLTPAKCIADNNYIHHIARLKRVYNPGISVYGVGNQATHNLIEHIPHMAIYFNGNDHLMEYNKIFDVCYESHDAGAIYAGRSWTQRGNIIRFNYLHDISGLEGKGCIGIYLDDLFCGTEIYGNVFNRVTRAVLIGGGRDNSVTNNIFIDCVPSIHVDARGLGWYAPYITALHVEVELNDTISGIIYNKPPYSTRFPQLTEILNDEPAAPKGNIISCNICLGGNWDKASGFWEMSIEDKARPYLIMENNIVSPTSGVEDSLSKSLIIADPLFSNQDNPEQGKFKLDANSPAIKRGFKQIPFDKIGLYKNQYRKNGSIN